MNQQNQSLASEACPEVEVVKKPRRGRKEKTPVKEKPPETSGAPTLMLKQAEVLEFISQGCSTKQIADHLEVSTKTVEAHRCRIIRGLEAKNMFHAVSLAYKKGLLQL